MSHSEFQIFLYFVIFNGINGVVVNTRFGPAKGITLSSRNGNKFDAFMGIPYAKPPINDLRLRNPQPLSEKWNGTFDGTVQPPVCPQMTPSGLIGDENCLYVNIYTPQLRNISEKLPVWIFVFGGRRILGHCLPHKYGPQYIMDKPVVLVTVSYRIGMLGYLSTEDTVISGNYGLKDQVMALRWVQENIDAFGGDPTNVTLSGGSSGASDVSLHMVSPLSKGLFHRCISQSASLLGPWTLDVPGTARNRSWEYAKHVGCANSSIHTSEQLLKCLQEKSSTEIVKGMFKLMHDYFLPENIVSPVIEQKYVDGAFLIENPAVVLQRSSSNIPLLVGFTGDDGSLGSVIILSNPKVVRHVNNNIDSFFPQFYTYEHSSVAENITEVFRTRYLKNRPIEEEPRALGMMYGISHTYIGAFETALKHRGPTYFFVYDYQNHPSYIRNYMTVAHSKEKGGMYVKHQTGPIHGEEMLSIFYFPALFPAVQKGDDRIVSDNVLNLWYNFVAYGDPNGIDSNRIWTPVSKPEVEYLHISNRSLTMKSGYLKEEYKFWNEFGNPFAITPESHPLLWKYV